MRKQETIGSWALKVSQDFISSCVCLLGKANRQLLEGQGDFRGQDINVRMRWLARGAAVVGGRPGMVRVDKVPAAARKKKKKKEKKEKKKNGVCVCVCEGRSRKIRRARKRSERIKR
jgi:hypothetical protein